MSTCLSGSYPAPSAYWDASTSIYITRQFWDVMRTRRRCEIKWPGKTNPSQVMTCVTCGLQCTHCAAAQKTTAAGEREQVGEPGRRIWGIDVEAEPSVPAKRKRDDVDLVGKPERDEARERPATRRIIKKTMLPPSKTEVDRTTKQKPRPVVKNPSSCRRSTRVRVPIHHKYQPRKDAEVIKSDRKPGAKRQHDALGSDPSISHHNDRNSFKPSQSDHSAKRRGYDADATQVMTHRRVVENARRVPKENLHV